MHDGIQYFEHYRSRDYIQPKYHSRAETNEEVKEFIVGVMEMIAADMERVEVLKEHLSSAATNVS